MTSSVRRGSALKLDGEIMHLAYHTRSCKFGRFLGSDYISQIQFSQTKKPPARISRHYAGPMPAPFAHIAASLTKQPNLKSTCPGLFKCRACRKPFTATMGRLYERSHIPLRWLLATHLMSASEKGVNACQLWRMTGFGSYSTRLDYGPSYP